MTGAAERGWFVSPRAEARLAHAERWLDALPEGSGALVVGATPEAPLALVRAWLAARPRAAVVGWHRLSLGALAGRLAALDLAEAGRVPASRLAVEALTARVVHDLRRTDAAALGRFQRVAEEPGLPRALARSLAELRLAQVGAPALARVDADLARILEALEAALAREALADRALVFETATRAVRGEASVASEELRSLVGLPVLLLDARVWHRVEADLLVALVARAPAALATLPAGEARAARLLEQAFGALPPAEARRTAPPPRARPLQLDLFAPAPPAPAPAAPEPEALRPLERLQRHLFADGEVVAPPSAEGAHDEVELFSAPGEGRECVEIARRIWAEAARGTPFDRIGILLRAPETHRVVLREALERAGIPYFSSRGSVRPSASGRALLALLACRAENLSARRFAEYLSLGVVPDADDAGAPPEAPEAGARFVPPDEELVPVPRPEQPPPDETDAAPEVVEGAPVRAGGLRSPRRWERLLVDAAVIGGADRWRRRLDGLEATLSTERAARLAEDADDPRVPSLDRRLDDLHALRSFALPLLEALAALPEEATWGEWIDALSALAHRAVTEPAAVTRVLAELAPMGPVGPVGLAEVRLVLTERLTELRAPSPHPAQGAVHVASIDEARGLLFDVVFVPGLAERVFPQKVTEDPILLDHAREALGADLERADDRVEAERTALRIAVGAARRRVVLSYPRLDLERARPRVPSFYGLEVVRATTGRLPGFEELGRRAETAGRARMAWPAPDDPMSAVDLGEFDLAVLRTLLDAPVEAQRGAARYLLETSAHLARALRARARRWSTAFGCSDGLVDPSPAAAAALARHRLDARPYSPTALEAFAACPYRFFLRAVLRLEPREVPEPIDELDPLQRGRLVHEAQRLLLESLRAEGRLDLPDEAALEAALARLDGIVREVAAQYREELVPAIERVWEDGVDEVRADLREWLRRVAADPWRPAHFELAFGLGDRPGHDPQSAPEPLALDVGLTLRGSIDLVEARGSALRATDHKTGRNRVPSTAVIDGGTSLQPALYALALERLFPGRPVDGGRLFYCTSRGEFSEHAVPLDAETRSSVALLVEVVGRALAEGFLPAAPAEGGCAWCDYRAVCGPNEERRWVRKRRDPLVPLLELRERR